MTRDEILDSVEKQEKKLVKSLNQTDEELEFLDDFITKTRFQGVKNLINIGITDFLIAYITSSSTKDFEEIYKKLENNRNFIDNVSQDGIISMGNLLQAILDFAKEYDLDINELSEKDKKESNEAIYRAIKEISDEKFNRYIEKPNILELAQLYNGIEEPFDDGIRVLVAIKDMIESNAALTEQISNYAQKYGAKTKKKAEARYREKELSSGYRMDEINKCIDKIIKYCDKKSKQNKRNIKNINKQLKSYKVFQKLFIEECKSKEITKVRELVERIPDDILRKEVLYFINNHNNKYYKEVVEEYNIISADAKNKIKTILNDYHIEFTDNDLKNIESSSSDLKFELSLLTKMNITDSNTLLSIIINTNKEIVTNIYRIIKEGIIDNNFVYNNINLFNKDLVVSDYYKLIENIEVLKKNNINPRAMANTKEILIMDSSLLDRNLKILDNYKLKDKLRKIENHTFLLKENLASTIDSILELGLESNLKDELDILNIDNIGIKRIRLLKELGEELSFEDIKKVVCDKEFFIPDNLLDEYIFNKVDYIDEDFLVEIDYEELEKYEDELTYNFDGVIISKNKVKRNINNYNDNIFRGIIKDSILNDVEVDTIINCLQTKKVKKLKFDT